MAKSKYGALKMPREFYDTSLSAKMFTEKEARAEYSRLARLANARIATMQRRGYGNAAVLKDYPATFAPAGGANEKQIRKRLQEVAHFMSLKTTSYTGARAARKKTVETLRANGYDFITMDNVEAFGRFMGAANDHYGNRHAYDSEQIADIFDYLDEINEIPDPEDAAALFEEYAGFAGDEIPDRDTAEQLVTIKKEAIKTEQQRMRGYEKRKADRKERAKKYEKKERKRRKK